MLFCLAVKEVQRCCVTAEIHQQCQQKTNSYQLGRSEETQSSRHLVFPDSLFFWLRLRKIITQLFVSHVSAGGGSIERLVTSYSLRKHAQCGVIVTQKKHLLECGWNWEEDMYNHSVHKCHNHLSHSEYLSILPFHRTRNTTHEISFTSVGVSYCVLHIVMDVFDKFYASRWKAGCEKKENNKSSQETSLLQYWLHNGSTIQVCVVEWRREAGYASTWNLWVMSKWERWGLCSWSVSWVPWCYYTCGKSASNEGRLIPGEQSDLYRAYVWAAAACREPVWKIYTKTLRNNFPVWCCMYRPRCTQLWGSILLNNHNHKTVGTASL